MLKISKSHPLIVRKLVDQRFHSKKYGDLVTPYSVGPLHEQNVLGKYWEKNLSNRHHHCSYSTK